MRTRPSRSTGCWNLQSKRDVEHAPDVVLEGRTSILIAHRLSTARKSDLVVLIEGGRFAGPDRRSNSCAGGRFAQMHTTWTEHRPT